MSALLAVAALVTAVARARSHTMLLTRVCEFAITAEIAVAVSDLEGLQVGAVALIVGPVVAAAAATASALALRAAHRGH